MKIKSIIIGATLSCLLYLSGFLSMFAPLPIMVLSGRKNVSYGLYAALTAFTLFFLVFNFFPAYLGGQGSFATIGLINFLFMLFLGVLWSEGIARRWDIVRLGSATLGISLFLGAGLLLFFNVEARDAISGIVMKSLEFQNSADSALIKKEVVNVILNFLPAFAVLSALVGLALNMWLGKRFSKDILLYRFDSLKVPEWLVWTLILFGGLYFVQTYLLKNEYIKLLAINGIFISIAIYFFQGLAVASSYVKKAKGLFLRWIFWLSVVFFFQFVSLILVGLGVADVWFDFRNRKLNLADRAS
ncbi:MAG: DUF2232 domain-containing protein [Pseudomonadota bacterium]